MKIKNHLGTFIGILILLVIAGYWYYNNSYVLLKPVLTKRTGELIIVPYTDEMIRNFPDVLKAYKIDYKLNDSGHFLIKAKYMHNTDFILTFTSCAIDSNKMKTIRKHIK